MTARSPLVAVVLVCSACSRAPDAGQPSPESQPEPTLAAKTQPNVELPPWKEIDPATVAAWVKAGFTEAEHAVLKNGLIIGGKATDRNAKKLPGQVPGFESADPRALENVNNLPPVGVPFGLALGISDKVDRRKLSDADLRHLTGLNNLVFLHVAANNDIGDAGLKHLASLTRLNTLLLSSTKVTDEGVKELVGLTNLTYLSLPPAAISDLSLRTLREANLLHALSGAKNAEGRRPAGAGDVASFRLVHGGGKLTDAALKEIATGFPNLTTLSLWYTGFTRTGLKELAGLKHLTTLTLPTTGITEADLDQLRKAMPNCNINRK